VNTLKLLLQYITAPFRFVLKGPTYLIAAPRKIWGMKPALRAAVLVAVFMLLSTAAIAVAFWLAPTARPGSDKIVGWTVAMTLLIIALPVSTYYLVRLWLEGDVSKYPDIDRAWDEGVAALAEHGLDLADLPLFIVLGAANEAECSALVAAGRVNPVVAGVPKGASPLRFYASANAIYLFCSGLGRLGGLSELAAAAGARAPAAGGGSPITATMVAGPSSRQTMSGPAFGAPPSPSATMAGGPILGTLIAGGGGGDRGGPPGEAAPVSSGMSRPQAELQTDRLEHAMQKLRRARQPYCASNGLLTILPHAVLSNVVYAREAPEAVRLDLNAVRNATRVAAPVTMVVAGMEAESGFTELVRRVGAERARSSRFGKGFDVWNVASDENLDALSLHACGSFEDWVYTLFAADDGSESRSNGKLFEMLCRVRKHLQPRLRGVLVNGYAMETEGNGEPPRLFSGCYFAATGRSADQQAFVRSVFEKLDQLSEDLQWSDAALREEGAYRWALRLATVLNIALMLAAGYFLFELVRRVL
jgi:hypothetical protein